MSSFVFVFSSDLRMGMKMELGQTTSLIQKCFKPWSWHQRTVSIYKECDTNFSSVTQMFRVHALKKKSCTWSTCLVQDVRQLRAFLKRLCSNADGDLSCPKNIVAIRNRYLLGEIQWIDFFIFVKILKNTQKTESCTSFVIDYFYNIHKHILQAQCKSSVLILCCFPQMPCKIPSKHLLGLVWEKEVFGNMFFGKRKWWGGRAVLPWNIKGAKRFPVCLSFTLGNCKSNFLPSQIRGLFLNSCLPSSRDKGA